MRVPFSYMQSCILEMMRSFFDILWKPWWCASFLLCFCWWACYDFCLGICVWKAKNNSIGNSSTITTESQSTKPEPDVHPPDTGPGRSFRNFRFDTPSILQAMEAAFSAWRQTLSFRCKVVWVHMAGRFPTISPVSLNTLINLHAGLVGVQAVHVCVRFSGLGYMYILYRIPFLAKICASLCSAFLLASFTFMHAWASVAWIALFFFPSFPPLGGGSSCPP
jgi:hypothetical protein